MGKTRDFRAETIENIRENLVDDENAGGFWDSIGDFFCDVFSFNKSLDADLGNFDKYMDRICEINDITAEKLQQIVDDVHTVENLYTTYMDMNSYNFGQISKMLKLLSDEVGKEDFEKSFDAAAVGTKLGTYGICQLKIDLSGLSDELFALELENLSIDKLSRVDASVLPENQRDMYFYKLLILFSTTLDEPNRQLLLGGLSRMEIEDAMRLVYDENGSYGGTQMNAAREWNNPDYLAILNNYPGIMSTHFPDMDEQQVKAFLSGFTSVGCGYVAAANGIFVHYLSRPDEFERIYGVPMFDSKGRFNIQALAVDIYCGVGDIASGTHQTSNISDYLISKGVTAATTNMPSGTPTQLDFQTALANGQTMVVDVNPTVMYDKNGNQYGAWTDDSYHAMSVTNIDSNGNITVSSWGGEYTILASDFSNYTIFRYEVTTYA